MMETRIEARGVRACVARRVTGWNKDEAKDRLYGGNAEGRFQLLGTGDWPANATWFDVAFDATTLYVSVMALQAGDAGLIQDGFKRDADCVEVFFDPFCDRIGYGQYIAGSEGTRAESSHWPYRDPSRDRYRDPAWSVTVEEEPQRPDLARFFFFRFELGRVKARDCIGFNVCRSQTRIHENSSWNLADGIGFPDPGCFGRLWFTPPPAACARAGVDRDGRRGLVIRLGGVVAPRGARVAARLVDPAGRTVAEPALQPARAEMMFRLPDRSPLRLAGRYRIVLEVRSVGRAIPLEPGEFYFDYAGRHPRAIQLQGTYDWPDHVMNVAYTPGNLEAEMRWYRDCGLDRVYWLDYAPEIYERSEWSFAKKRAASIRRSLRAFGGDFLEPAVRAARKAGLEFITIFKPFDLGERVGFIQRNPRFQIRRNPDWISKPQYPIRSIRLYQSDEAPWPFSARNLTVWQSRDNKEYRRARFGAVRDSVVKRAEGVWSPCGRIPGGTERVVRCLRIEGLALDTPFLALSLESCKPDVAVRNRAYLLAEIEDASGAVRPYVVDAGGTPEAGFRLTPHLFNGPSWCRTDTGPDRLLRLNGTRLCLGFGLEPELHMPGFLEPCFPEVRAFWLEYLKRGLDAGADGVSLRLAHHLGCSDWLSHMYAVPVLETFRRQAGRDPEVSGSDYERIRRIRGAAYTQFLREASAMARGAGKRFLHHIENRMLAPPDGDTYCQIHWDWQTWLREKLFDEIDLKYIGPNHPDAYREIVPMARKAGVKINVITADPDPRTWPRSLRQAPLLLRQARAAGLDGIDLYELWLYHRWTDRGYPMVRGSGESVIREMRAAREGCTGDT